MEPPHPFRFPAGTTLEKELSAAMDRIGSSGVVYPEGYYDQLLEKLVREEILYPFALMLAGTPRLRNHFAFPRVRQRMGRFLDYGCGCGDSVRSLLRDGYPRDLLTAFDITRSAIDLGYDLYRDRGAVSGLFVVSAAFPFGPEEFDAVYSSNVIHCLGDDQEFRQYLENACATLRQGGIFFGQTMGCLEDVGAFPQESGLARVVTRGQLEESLRYAGFSAAEIVRKPLLTTPVASLVTTGTALRLTRPVFRSLFRTFPGFNNYNFHMFQFSAVKMASRT